MKQEEHTPIPWIARGMMTGFGNEPAIRIEATTGAPSMRRVAYAVNFPNKEADAQFIVQAVNSHAELLEALEALLDFADNVRNLEDTEGQATRNELVSAIRESADEARNAINKARGQA